MSAENQRQHAAQDQQPLPLDFLAQPHGRHQFERAGHHGPRADEQDQHQRRRRPARSIVSTPAATPTHALKDLRPRTPARAAEAEHEISGAVEDRVEREDADQDREVIPGQTIARTPRVIADRASNNQKGGRSIATPPGRIHR